MRDVRAWMALVAITCTLVVATIALLPVHGHSQQRNCDVCISAHLALHPAVEAITVSAPGAFEWRSAPEPAAQVFESAATSADSRAPPAGS